MTVEAVKVGAMSERWQVPAWMSGDTSLVRIGASSVDDGEYSCPEQLATKARPRVSARNKSFEPAGRYDDFVLGLIMEVLERHEFGGETVDQALAAVTASPRVYEGVARWIRHAVYSYKSSAASGVGEPLHAVAEQWVVQEQRQRTWEMYAWGRRYESDDATLREFRFLSNDRAAHRVRHPGRTAIAAYTAAFGSPAAALESWKHRYELQPSAGLVQRVRVVEVGLLDGTQSVLFDGTPAEAEALFADEGRDHVRAIDHGGVRRPGSACLNCKQRLGCPALPAADGLLGIIPAQRMPLRTWSATDGRAFNDCPAQEHMRRLHLPRVDEYGPEAVRGQAVHAFLEAAHRRLPHRACREADLPPMADDWSAGRWHVTGEQALDGYNMLLQHLQVCPLQHLDQITKVEPEQNLTYFDRDANILVMVKPDLLFTEGTSWVWRETKTANRHRARTGILLPQIALGVLILQRDLLGGPGEHRVELETLTPHGVDIELFDPANPDVLTVAGQVVAAHAELWHHDDPVVTKPGRYCRTCPAQRWCPDPDAAAAAAAADN